MGLELPSGVPGGSPEEGAHSVPPEDVGRVAEHALVGLDRKLGHSGRQVRGTAVKQKLFGCDWSETPWDMRSIKGPIL